MKNIYLIPTENRGRITKMNNQLSIEEIPIFSEPSIKMDVFNLYITSDEEIKEGDWFYDLDTKYIKIKQSWENSHLMFNGKKIILTTDEDLIKDGVQAIDDEFLQWYIKNPSCEEVDYCNWNEYYKITPKEEVLLQSSIDGEVIWGEKQETLEEVKDLSYWRNNAEEDYSKVPISVLKYISELEKQQDKNKYSEEDLEVAFFEGQFGRYSFNDWIGQFKKK